MSYVSAVTHILTADIVRMHSDHIYTTNRANKAITQCAIMTYAWKVEQNIRYIFHIETYMIQTIGESNNYN